jgi:hypothetical protein
MHLDSLILIAQISVALTGFVGIIVAIREWHGKGLARLLLASILQTTLGAAFFALIPDPLSHLVSMDSMWRIACGAFGLYHLGIWAQHVVRQRSLATMGAVQKIVTIASMPVIALKLCVGLGFLLRHAYPIYYLGLTWLLGVGCYAFILILFDDGDSRTGDEEPPRDSSPGA